MRPPAPPPNGYGAALLSGHMSPLALRIGRLSSPSLTLHDLAQAVIAARGGDNVIALEQLRANLLRGAEQLGVVDVRDIHEIAVLRQRLCQLVARFSGIDAVLLHRLLLRVLDALVEFGLGLLLVRLLLRHELVQRFLHVLHPAGLVRLGVERHPHAHGAHVHVVVRIDLAQHLAAQLGLFLGAVHAAHFKAANRRLKIVARVEFRLQLLLVVVHERLELVRDGRL